MSNIKLTDIRDQYIKRALENKGYRFKIFVNAGAFRKSQCDDQRVRKGIINALLEATDSDVVYLGGGMKASALNVKLTFLLPLPAESTDERSNDYGGEYTFADEFRDMLTEAFSDTEALTLESDGRTYVGGVTSTFPMTGEMAQRQGIGYSYEYVCYFQFTYLAGGINASDVHFYLDDDETEIPYTSFVIARKNTVSAALLSNAVNGEATAYAESSNFAVDLSLPAIDTNNATGAAIYNFLFNIVDGNTPHTLKIVYGNKPAVEKRVIFSDASHEGANVENVAAKISFIPYMSAEDQSS